MTIDTDEPRSPGALDDMETGLSALRHALDLQDRAAHTGFDWPDTLGVKAKIFEEMEELDAASSHNDVEDEAGDLLFSVVNLVRHRGVDPDVALHRANAKFARRFRMMEALAGENFATLSLEAKEELWREAKRRGL